MKFLLISQDEQNAFLLDRLQQEGHETRWLSRGGPQGVWDGVIQKLPSTQEAVAWDPDIVIVDGPGFGTVIKSFDKRPIGGGKFQDQLSSDWVYSMSVMENAKVATHAVEKFDNVFEASEYMLGKDQAWMFRYPDGSGFSARSTETMQEKLEEMATAEKIPPQFSLQRAFPPLDKQQIAIRPEHYIAGMFTDKGLMDPCVSFRMAYGLLPNDQGIPTIEGVSMSVIPKGEPECQETLCKMEAAFKSMNYRGWAFAGVVYDTRKTDKDGNSFDWGPIVTDFFLTPPPGFWAAFVAGLQIKLGHFFDRVCNPKSNTFGFWNGTVSSRLLSVPPYPTTEAKWLPEDLREQLVAQVPPITIPYADWGVFWNGIIKADEGLKLTGPKIGWVVGRGPTYQDSLNQIRTTSLGLPIPAVQCKVDADSTFEYDIYSYRNTIPISEYHREG